MSLGLVLHQTAPIRGDLPGNVAAAAEALGAAPAADLHIFPELSLTGYDLGSWATDLALESGDGPPPRVLEARPGLRGAVLLGFPEQSDDGRLFNAVGLAGDRGWILKHRKRYLPTYGAFDEGRIFAPGTAGPAVTTLAGGWRVAFLVCEELWHPALPYLAALRGADLLAVAAAAPGRGAPGPGDPPGFASSETWELLARTAAVQHGIYVALVNRVGVEGATTFAGQSLLVDPRGRVLGRGKVGEPDSLHALLDRDEVLRARRPFSHLRDEDPRLFADELRRLEAPGDEGPGR